LSASDVFTISVSEVLDQWIALIAFSNFCKQRQIGLIRRKMERRLIWPLYDIPEGDFLMSSQPDVKVGDWVSVGNGVNGLVMGVYPDHLAVGYYQNQIKAIKEDVVWKNGHWEFKYSGPNGSYLRGSEAATVKRGPPRQP
jgi:hypothetical protein